MTSELLFDHFVTQLVTKFNNWLLLVTLRKGDLLFVMKLLYQKVNKFSKRKLDRDLSTIILEIAG